VAAGDCHALALTEEGELYGWGDGDANGHGRAERTPQRVAALIGQRVKLVNAQGLCSCAVTEKGELFTWGVYFLQNPAQMTTSATKGQRACRREWPG